jgi:Domain of unknown function (DUF4249)
MKTYKLLFIFILTASILMSCETVLENVTVPYEERLVVSSFISPQDSLVEVIVSKTKPVTGVTTGSNNFNNQNYFYDILKGATVQISDGQQKANLVYKEIIKPFSFVYDPVTKKQTLATRPGYFISTKEFPIIAGKTYTLVVSATGLPTATATCTVPTKSLVNQSDLEIVDNGLDSVVSGSSYLNGQLVSNSYRYHKKYTVKIKDNPSEENFYSVGYLSQKIEQTKGSDGKVITLSPLNLQEPYGDLLSDYRKNGTVLNFIPLRMNLASDNNNPNSKVISYKVSCFVAITDKTFYQYNKSIGNSSGIYNDNPFAEPVLTYTNINGGLGAFAGYNMTRVDVDLLKK